jgi:polygalacturonase
MIIMAHTQFPRNSQLTISLTFVLAFSCIVGDPNSASAQNYRLIDAGAVGDGITVNTSAIQSVIDSCAGAGGGTIELTPGTFLTGTLRLRSHVTLHLDNGAVLKGTDRLEDYRLNGTLVGLLFTQNESHIAITGEGTIDGNGDSFMDFTTPKKIDSTGSAYTRQKRSFRMVESGLGDGPVVPGDRPYQMVIFSNCRDVTLQDVHFTNSPFWTVHCADCDGVNVSGVRIWCNLLVPNNDGIDFTSCSNVQMSDCDIRTGDDCVVLTGYDHHFDLPGFNHLRHPSENIVISNCTLQSRSAAIRIGGFDQNPMRNFVFSNICITNSNRGIGIFARDQGSIENVLFSNIVIETHLHTGDWWGQGEPIHLSAVRLLRDVTPGMIRHIRFENIVCRGESGIIVYGTEESVIQDVTFDKLMLRMEDSPLNDVAGGNIDLRPVLDQKLSIFAHDIPGFYARWVSDLRLRGLSLTWGKVSEPFFTHGVDIENFHGVSIEDFEGTAAPGNAGAFPIFIRDGTGYDIRPAGVSVHTINAGKK